MDIDRFTSLIARISTLAAAVLVVLAGTEWLLNLVGYSVLRGTYTSGRLLEFSAILMLFVMTDWAVGPETAAFPLSIS